MRKDLTPGGIKAGIKRQDGDIDSTAKAVFFDEISP